MSKLQETNILRYSYDTIEKLQGVKHHECDHSKMARC
jgi:hypothetical protein